MQELMCHPHSLGHPVHDTEVKRLLLLQRRNEFICSNNTTGCCSDFIQLLVL